jgi:lysophospholipase L1-like esterase
MLRAHRPVVIAVLLAGVSGLVGFFGSVSSPVDESARLAVPWLEVVRSASADPAPSAPGQASTPPAQPSAAPAQGATQGAKQRYVVAAIGDSLTDARSHGGKFLTYLKEKCPASQFDNYGKGGDMVNQMRKRFFRDVMVAPAAKGAGAALAAKKPAYTHVIVFGGVNDLYSDLTAGRTPKKVAKDLTEMYAASKKAGARVVALTVAPWGGFKAYYNASRGKATLELNRWILGQKGAGAVDFVIDTYPMLSCGDPERLCPSVMAPFKDGLHFGPEGHARIGKALHEQVFADCL